MVRGFYPEKVNHQDNSTFSDTVIEKRQEETKCMYLYILGPIHSIKNTDYLNSELNGKFQLKKTDFAIRAVSSFSLEIYRGFSG